MDKSKDPAIEFIEQMREQGKYFNVQEAFLGVVTSPPPNLKVRMNNIILNKENMYICKSVIDRKNATVESGYKWSLKSGDKVLLIMCSGIYIVVDKVVSA